MNTDLQPLDHDACTVVPFPRIRLPMVDGGRMARRRHTVHGLVEFDVTAAREAIHRHKAATGETLSFTAFMVACLGQAVAANRYLHACRDWRGRIVLFDEVDVNTLFEVEVEGKPEIRPHILRGVNCKTVRDLRLPHGSVVLDLACGTGDLCRELAGSGLPGHGSAWRRQRPVATSHSSPAGQTGHGGGGAKASAPAS